MGEYFTRVGINRFGGKGEVFTMRDDWDDLWVGLLGDNSPTLHTYLPTLKSPYQALKHQ
jgi:hypothetical protein